MGKRTRWAMQFPNDVIHQNRGGMYFHLTDHHAVPHSIMKPSMGRGPTGSADRSLVFSSSPPIISPISTGHSCLISSQHT